jgi:hypothetical protein
MLELDQKCHSWDQRSTYIPAGKLFGIAMEGRAGGADFGITFEGGRVGHGSELEAKDKSEGKYKRKLNRFETAGTGTLNVLNAYLQIGVDISPILLAPLGIVIEKGESTSFFSVSAGINVGGHLAWNQHFDNPSIQTFYDYEIVADQSKAKEKFIDPSKAKAGYLGGFYLSVQVGAMDFKFTNYRYYGAPFASTCMFSLAYRIPRTAEK